jgi:hypothetical protein
MKTMLMILLSAGLSHAAALNLNKAEEFQYVHCQIDVKSGDTQHFVFDLRAEPHAYYSQKAGKDRKAVQLDKLALQDSSLESKPDSDDDVTWNSKQTGQKFKLYISDNAGYLMKGKLHEGKDKKAVSCSDVTQE